MGRRASKKNSKRVSDGNRQLQNKLGITNIAYDCSKIGNQSSESIMRDSSEEFWKMFEKGPQCAGENTKCLCGKLHLYQVCDVMARSEYRLYEHVMANKWMLRLKPSFHYQDGNRKRLWSQLAYNLLLTAFRDKMTEGAYAYYQFTFPVLGGRFHTKFLPHSVLTPQYLADSFFPASIDDREFVQPFYINVYAINMDNWEEDAAEYDVQQLKILIEEWDFKVTEDLICMMNSTTSECNRRRAEETENRLNNENKGATSDPATIPDVSKSVTNNNEDYGGYFFTAEHFKNNTILAEKARTREIPVSAVYKIVSWHMRPHTSDSLSKHFSIEIDHQFIQQAKDLRLVIATVCCELERNYGQCLPSQAKRAIGIRLISGKDKLTFGMYTEAELNPEVAKNKLFEECSVDFVVGETVEIDVEWRTLS